MGFGEDKWGNPTIEVEPVPKGRKQNKVIGLYRIWRADVKEKALAEQAKATLRVAALFVARMVAQYGTAGVHLTYQAKFPYEAPCVKCGKAARLAVTMREEFDDAKTPEQQTFATRLHRNGEDKKFWLHDCAAFATYLCTDRKCASATTLWNQG